MPVLIKKPLGGGTTTNTTPNEDPSPPRKGPVSFAAAARAGSSAPVRYPVGSQAPHRQPGSQAPSGIDGLRERLGDMSIGRIVTYEPTTAPTPRMNQSRPTTNYPHSQAASVKTTGTRRTTRGCPPMNGRNGKDWINTPECIKAPYGAHDFNKGDVISVPFHVNNMNPDAKFSDPSLRETGEGPVYTKRRMLVVLFKYKEGMHCLPLYSFGSRGMKAKLTPFDTRDHYVCLRDIKHSDFVNEGSNAPVDFVHSNPYDQLSRETTIHLAGGIRVHWEEYIGVVGRLTKEGYLRLLKHWKVLQQVAESEPAGGTWPTVPVR
ncbi:uncharacterized protein RCC_04472 [Ramularia collo-cygni]|uniref:DUF6590 domain-containing protein n=1 Tax=Ramularia collo-cygni TaxID=112498 RepID=A0A2D3UU45_9PEZI|nr:uncharacterized protein RCC_04472 [Ramularia collo-cygni]CZT18628.1 uncharacterized protein RCC_04472 [Ramularia collo-cygni]